MNQSNIHPELARLRTMCVADLRQKYLDLFGEPSRSGNRDFLCKRMAWRIQSLAEGSLSERARQRAMELARDADIRTTVPRLPKAGTTHATVPVPPGSSRNRLPMPGAVLTRVYRGRTVAVTVLPKGFEFDGQIYRSLSAVAKIITGAHWNGYLFFGLAQAGEMPA
ncbi:MAG: DUF2924 domain-containing protein [Planctomycetaceae bacterium]|nr:DUF2924 domain-containing protein [Planctomycetaceae bacterium]